MEVVEQDIIMLLGANSLSKGSAILDIGNLNITFPEAFGSTVRFPINYADSGHFTMNFYSLAKEDGYEAAQTYLTSTDWNSDSASSLINYVKFNNRVQSQISQRSSESLFNKEWEEKQSESFQTSIEPERH